MLKTAIGSLPSILSMYLLYWLESNKIRNLCAAYRDAMTMAVLFVGMSLYSLTIV